MITLVIGGSASGKSEYAESHIDFISEGKKKYYIATMNVSDSESKERVERHRKIREGKGFITVEQPVDIHKAKDKMDIGAKTALVECMSNLAANEMFPEKAHRTEEEVAEKIVKGIKELGKEIDSLVIVSNNVFEDGKTYDQTVMEYVNAMGRINRELALVAGCVVEVAAGIPLVIKGGMPCAF